jgi:DUF4097 and DUF4098 domain-containing protein YvlB
MKHEGLIYLAGAALLLAPGSVHARNHNLSINTNNSRGEALSCADLRVKSNGEVAQTTESFTLSRAEAPLLEINGATNGDIRVHAWDRAEYSVETCKIAAADTGAMADQAARAISIGHSAGNITFRGPVGDDADWTVVFLIRAPKDAVVNLETVNGPIEVKGLSGSVRLRAVNGPIAIGDCTGNVEASTTNGPIAFTGERGDVHLRADNGPIAVNLTADAWSGPLLDARTVNGPLALRMPDTFRSGVRLESSGLLSCKASPCRSAFTDRGGRTMQMNGASDVIRLSTENGPMAVQGGRR